MKKNRSGKPVSPIYTVAAVWLGYSLLFHPVSTIGRLLGVAALSVIGYNIARLFTGGKKTDTAKTRQEAKTAHKTEPSRPASTVQPPQSAAAATVAKQKEAQKPKYPAEVQAVVDEGAKAHTELARLYASIPNLAVKRKIQQIIEISDKIVADAVDDPSDVPQIKKFLDYYLPTTIKLLNAYDRMGAQGVQGENITGTMKSIDEMLDTAIDAYNKLLDSLFANQAMDIETDIAVMNTLLKREGFINHNNGGSAFRTQRK